MTAREEEDTVSRAAVSPPSHDHGTLRPPRSPRAPNPRGVGAVNHSESGAAVAKRLSLLWATGAFVLFP